MSVEVTATDDVKWKTFLRLLAKNYSTVEMRLTGSRAELGYFDKSYRSDCDVMVYHTDILGIFDLVHLPKSFKGRVIILQPASSHPGYACLEQTDHDFLKKPTQSFEIFTQSHGPARTIPTNHPMHDAIRELIPPGNSIQSDAVFSLRCLGWPEAAAEWKTRSRPSGWPPQDLIESIVKTDYHLVDKSHPSHKGNEILWRISFSKAEVFLIRSWTKEQRFFYQVLRQIKQEVVRLCGGVYEASLCTYYFKTLMLWECERQPRNFWELDNLNTSVSELLCKFIGWLIERNCPNYFISSNNMLNHISDDQDFSQEVEFLVKFAETQVVEFTTNIEDSTLPDFFPAINGNHDSKGSLHISALFWRNCSDTDDDISSMDLIYEKHTEIKFLFEALICQVRLMRSTDGVPKTAEGVMKTAEEKFLQALFTTKYQDLVSVDANVGLFFVTHFCEILCTDQIESCFACAAYLANFYYVTKRDYSLCSKICRIVIDAGKRNIIVMARGELGYPVLLTVDLLDAFDLNIQKTIGFLRLCEKIEEEFGKTALCSWDVVRFCPMTFIHYINFHCQIRLGMDIDVVRMAFKDFMVQCIALCPTDGHKWDTDLPTWKIVFVILNSLTLRSLNRKSNKNGSEKRFGNE